MIFVTRPNGGFCAFIRFFVTLKKGKRYFAFPYHCAVMCVSFAFRAPSFLFT